MADTRYKRVVLKLSGESLSPDSASGFDPGAAQSVAEEIARVVELDVQVALVLGAGNFIRGRDLADAPAIRRTTADSMGMLATTINALALGDVLEAAGLGVCVTSAVPMSPICEPFVAARARRHLDEGRVVLLAGGTGLPFFTTDTCAALRALQLGAEVVVKGTRVDGVFDSDPETNPEAVRYDRLTYEKVLADALGVMDLTAVALCRENDLPIVVCRLDHPGNLAAAVRGEHVGTIVTN